jgi:hypothetical protein
MSKSGNPCRALCGTEGAHPRQSAMRGFPGDRDENFRRPSGNREMQKKSLRCLLREKIARPREVWAKRGLTLGDALTRQGLPTWLFPQTSQSCFLLLNHNHHCSYHPKSILPSSFHLQIVGSQELSQYSTLCIRFHSAWLRVSMFEI